MTPTERLEKAIKEIDNMARWINLDSEEVQSLIIEDEYGNQYLDMDELDEIAHIFPTTVESGVLEL